MRVTIALSLIAVLGGAPLQPVAAHAQEPPAAWEDLKPDLPRRAVKRRTHRLPLSDQADRGGWELYKPLTDEFKGGKLGPARWNNPNPTWKGRQPGWFSPRNVEVKGGQMHLTMRKEEPADMPKAEGYHTWTSAAVQSKERVLYGYFEVRARAMKSHGSSAFWFYASEPERWTEIDVFEIGGGAPSFARKLFMTCHVMHSPEVKQHLSVGGVWNAPFDLADQYHVYGLEWDEASIRFYFDGLLVRQGPNVHWHQPLTMNFDSETMPDWFGLPLDKDLPSTFSVDYVRTWKKKAAQP